ncbi:MAG: hypothetical protein R3E32_29160 [Chitinophagales bacterium]
MLSKLTHFLAHFLIHFTLGLSFFSKAVSFIQKHELWKGMKQYGWLNRLSVLAGVVLGVKIFMMLMEFLLNIPLFNPIEMTSSIFHLFSKVGTESYQLFFLGGFKYLIVLALEVLIIHFGGKTTEVLTGVPFHLTFKEFIADQIRAVKVIIQKYILELIVTIIIGIVLGILGIDFLKTPLIFIAQCYFLGVVLMDNYFKQRGKTVRQSEEIIRRYAGLATAIGMVFYILLFIPIIGAVMGACIAAVASTLALHKLKPLEQGQTQKVEIGGYV